MSGYAFHPDAFADLDEIWEYIAQDNIDAADMVLADIHYARGPVTQLTTRLCLQLHEYVELPPLGGRHRQDAVFHESVTLRARAKRSRWRMAS